MSMTSRSKQSRNEVLFRTGVTGNKRLMRLVRREGEPERSVDLCRKGCNGSVRTARLSINLLLSRFFECGP